MSRRALIMQLAPVAPPCFDSRLLWLEWLTAAAEAASEKGQPNPLLFKAGQPVRFDVRINFCQDCDEIFRRAMQDCNRCKPDWLVRDVPTLTQEVIDV